MGGREGAIDQVDYSKPPVRNRSVSVRSGFPSIQRVTAKGLFHS